MDMVYSKICDMFSAYVLVKIEMEEEEDGGVILGLLYPSILLEGNYYYMLVHLWQRCLFYQKKKSFEYFERNLAPGGEAEKNEF